MKANSDAWIALEDEEEGDGEETARALFVEEEEEEEEEGTDLESDSELIKDLIDHFWKLYVYFLSTIFSIDNFAVPQNDDLICLLQPKTSAATLWERVQK